MFILLFVTSKIRFFVSVITLSLFDDVNTLLISIINIMTIHERFAEILNTKNISIKETARLLDRADIYIRKSMRPGESFGIEPVTKIVNSICDINSDWLLSEKENMFRDKHLPTNTNGKGVPYLEGIEATFLQAWTYALLLNSSVIVLCDKYGLIVYEEGQGFDRDRYKKY